MLTQTLKKSFWKVTFAFARVKRNSEWVYSNKADEMNHAKKGKVFVCNHPGDDSYNFTLRMHKTLELSHMVLSQLPIDSAKLLQAIAQKQRFIDSTP